VRVEWAIPCRYAELEGGTATIVGAGVDVFFVADLPAIIGMMVVMKLSGSAEEWEAQFTLGFQILDPSAPVVREESIEIGAQLGTQLFPTWERGGIIPTAHEFEVAEPGALQPRDPRRWRQQAVGALLHSARPITVLSEAGELVPARRWT